MIPESNSCYSLASPHVWCKKKCSSLAAWWVMWVRSNTNALNLAPPSPRATIQHQETAWRGRNRLPGWVNPKIFEGKEYSPTSNHDGTHSYRTPTNFPTFHCYRSGTSATEDKSGKWKLWKEVTWTVQISMAYRRETTLQLSPSWNGNERALQWLLEQFCRSQVLVLWVHESILPDSHPSKLRWPWYHSERVLRGIHIGSHRSAHRFSAESIRAPTLRNFGSCGYTIHEHGTVIEVQPPGQRPNLPPPAVTIAEGLQYKSCICPHKPPENVGCWDDPGQPEC